MKYNPKNNTRDLFECFELWVRLETGPGGSLISVYFGFSFCFIRNREWVLIYIGMVYIMSNIGVVVSPAVVFFSSSFCAFSFSLFQPFHISNSWEREMSSLYSTSFWESGVKNRDIFYWSNTKKRYILAWATCKHSKLL